MPRALANNPCSRDVRAGSVAYSRAGSVARAGSTYRATSMARAGSTARSDRSNLTINYFP